MEKPLFDPKDLVFDTIFFKEVPEPEGGWQFDDVTPLNYHTAEYDPKDVTYVDLTGGKFFKWLGKKG